MARPVPVHYLRPNETEWSPRSVAFFDTEATPIQEGDNEVLVFRLWCGRSVRRVQHGGAGGDDRRDHGSDPMSLAAWISEQTIGVNSTWVYAHNLGFDLSCAHLVTHLTAIGWTCSDFGADEHHPWFRFARGSKRLTLCDSWSWLSTALEAIGQAVGVRKPALPTWDDDEAAWLARCYGDVDVMAHAVLSLMDWWDRERLGRWSLTGAATGWNAMRHISRRKVVLIDPTPDARAFERRAVRGGRRDVWRCGRLDSGPYAAVDLERAHATIAEHLPLPFKRRGRFDHLPLDTPWLGDRRRSIIAEAVVCTAEPRYPVKVAGATWWPTGTFRTVLAGPELTMARDRGELVGIGPGYRYLLGNQLQDWASWCNRVASGREPTTPPAAQLAAKGWGRSVLGKFAAHSSDVTVQGVSLSPGFMVEAGWNHATKRKAQVVDLGENRFWIEHDLDADDCFPAVLAFVESYLRVRMAAVIDWLGPDLLVSCDTDGLVVDLPRLVHRKLRPHGQATWPRTPMRIAQRLCEHLAPMVAPLTLRPKSMHEHMTVTGPQQLIVTGARHFSGVRSTAVPAEDGALVARTWPKWRWQMTHGDPRGYVRPRITYRLTGGYVRKWVLGLGVPYPVEARMGPDGETELVPWSETADRPDGVLLAKVQHKVLEGLR